MTPAPWACHRTILLPEGEVLGCGYRWSGGQYCSLNTPHGVVGCGIFDVAVANRFGMAFAIARGTPEHPLCEPEDLLDAAIREVSDAAAALGIRVGMTGREAVACMLRGGGAGG